MRDEEVNVFRLHLLLFEQFGNETCEGAYRNFEDFTPFHVDERQAVAHRICSGTTAAWHQQQFFVAAVAVQHRTVDTRLICRFQNDRTGAVAKENRSTAVAPVKNVAEQLRTNNQRPFATACADEVVGGSQREDKAGAGSLHIKGSNGLATEAGLQLAGVARKDVFRGRCGDDDEVQRRRVNIGALQGVACGLIGKIRAAFIRRGDVTLCDAGTSTNPLVGGVHPLGEFLVGHDPLRQIAAGAEDFAVNHAVGSSAAGRFC